MIINYYLLNILFIISVINLVINYHLIILFNEAIWGLGIGDWGLGNPQSPIPNPQILVYLYLSQYS